MNNDTTCLTKALQNQTYFKFIVILSIALSMFSYLQPNDY